MLFFVMLCINGWFVLNNVIEFFVEVEWILFNWVNVIVLISELIV